jgi:hypothetical protein
VLRKSGIPVLLVRTGDREAKKQVESARQERVGTI